MAPKIKQFLTSQGKREAALRTVPKADSFVVPYRAAHRGQNPRGPEGKMKRTFWKRAAEASHRTFFGGKGPSWLRCL